MRSDLLNYGGHLAVHVIEAGIFEMNQSSLASVRAAADRWDFEC